MDEFENIAATTQHQVMGVGTDNLETVPTNAFTLAALRWQRDTMVAGIKDAVAEGIEVGWSRVVANGGPRSGRLRSIGVTGGAAGGVGLGSGAGLLYLIERLLS
jgi:hypothetical protein